MDRKCLLQIFLVEFEENLHGSAKAGCLDFPPKSALVATYTVHDSTDISEVLLKLLFEDLDATC
jgi:hypothetical protein